MRVAIEVANKRQGAAGEYVGRPSALGNPFRMDSESERAKVIAQYDEWLAQKIEQRDPRVCGELNRLYKLARENGSLVLVCWCAPKACHADVIARVLREKLDR